MMTRKLQRYVLWECITAFALTMSVVISAILLVDVVEQMRTIGDNVDITLGQAAQLTLMKMPMLIEQTMPFVLLVMAILAFNRLSRRVELPAMRAAGLSAWRFLAPLIVFSALVGIFTITVLNPLGARLNAAFEDARTSLLSQELNVVNVDKNGLWLRQGDETGQFVIHARYVEPSGTALEDVRLFEYERIYNAGQQTDDFAFRRRLLAERAVLRDGFWQLEMVQDIVPGQEIQRTDFLSIPTDLSAETLLDRFASPNTIGFWELPGFIRQTQDAGLDAARYKMRYESMRAAPVLYVAMALVGALVCLRLARLGGTSVLIGWGAFTAVMIYFVTQFAGSLGSAGAAPAYAAAWAPPLFALFAALTAVAYLEDG